MEIISAEAGKVLAIPLSLLTETGDRLRPAVIKIEVRKASGEVLVPMHEFNPSGNHIVPAMQLVTEAIGEPEQPKNPNDGGGDGNGEGNDGAGGETGGAWEGDGGTGGEIPYEPEPEPEPEPALPPPDIGDGEGLDEGDDPSSEYEPEPDELGEEVDQSPEAGQQEGDGFAVSFASVVAILESEPDPKPKYTFVPPTVEWYDPESLPDSITIFVDKSYTKQDELTGKNEHLVATIEGQDIENVPFSIEKLIVLHTDILLPWVTSCAEFRPMLFATHDHPVALIGELVAMTKGEFQRTMANAFGSLLSLPLRVRVQSKHVGKAFAALTTQERIEVVEADPKFAQAMMHAQILEACEYASADPVTQARANGLISMTVGESSQFYGSSKTLASTTQVTSKKAMQLLSPWLDFSVRLARS